MIDPAFGIMTRPALEYYLEKRRYPMTVVLIDLKNLHDMNSKYGYEKVNNMVREALYPLRNHLIGRWFMGDEILIAEADETKIARKLERAFNHYDIGFQYWMTKVSSFDDLKKKFKNIVPKSR
jgi:GGDEF domain-containing protein